MSSESTRIWWLCNYSDDPLTFDDGLPWSVEPDFVHFKPLFPRRYRPPNFRTMGDVEGGYLFVYSPHGVW